MLQWQKSYASATIIAVFALVGVPHAALALGDASPVAIDGNSANKAKAEERGRQLRADLEREYASKIETVHPPPRHVILNGDIVLKSIPAGSSFKDAEVILRAAGFKYQIKDTQKNAAHLEGWLVLRDILLAKTEVAIDLLPRIENDLSSGVGKASASIFVTNP